MKRQSKKPSKLTPKTDGMVWRLGFLVHENQAKKIDEILRKRDSNKRGDNDQTS